MQSANQRHLLQAIEDGTLSSTEQDKKRRRKRRTLNADLDDDDDGQQLEESDSRFDDGEADSLQSKSSKQARVGKRKMKESSKHYSNDSIPSKLLKQMQTLLDFVIKYRDKYVDFLLPSMRQQQSSSLSAKTTECSVNHSCVCQRRKNCRNTMKWSNIRWISIKSRFVRSSIEHSVDLPLRLEKNGWIPLSNDRWTGSRCVVVVQECSRIQHGKLQCNWSPLKNRQTSVDLSLVFRSTKIRLFSSLSSPMRVNDLKKVKFRSVRIPKENQMMMVREYLCRSTSNTCPPFLEPLKKRVKKDTHVKKVMRNTNIIVSRRSSLCRNLLGKHVRPVMEVWAVERVVAKRVWWVTKKIRWWMKPIRFVEKLLMIELRWYRLLSLRMVEWTTTMLKRTTWMMKALVVLVHDKNEHVEILFAVCLSVTLYACFSSTVKRVCVCVCVYSVQRQNQKVATNVSKETRRCREDRSENEQFRCAIFAWLGKQTNELSLLFWPSANLSRVDYFRLYIRSYCLFVFLSLSLSLVLFSSMLRLDFFSLCSYCSFLR